MPAGHDERRAGLLLSVLELPPQVLPPTTLQGVCKPSMPMGEYTPSASRSMCGRASQRRGRPATLSAEELAMYPKLAVFAVAAMERQNNERDRRAIDAGSERQGVDGENRSGRGGKVFRGNAQARKGRGRETGFDQAANSAVWLVR